ncbi:hypothetical protein CsSME_00049544 [Camellia sinensis var. sinensis]
MAATAGSPGISIRTPPPPPPKHSIRRRRTQKGLRRPHRSARARRRDRRLRLSRRRVHGDPPSPAALPTHPQRPLPPRARRHLRRRGLRTRLQPPRRLHRPLRPRRHPPSQRPRRRNARQRPRRGHHWSSPQAHDRH